MKMVDTLAARWAEHENVMQMLQIHPNAISFARQGFYAGATEVVKMVSSPITSTPLESDEAIRVAAGEMTDKIIGVMNELQDFHAKIRDQSARKLAELEHDRGEMPESISKAIDAIMARVRAEEEVGVDDIDPKRGFGD